MRLIAIQESVEIMKGADWSIVRNNTVHRRRLDRFPHGGSRFTAQFSQLPQIAKTPLAAACSARTFACVNLLSFHHLSFPTYHEDVISALYPSIHPIIFDQFCSVSRNDSIYANRNFPSLLNFLSFFQSKLPIQSDLKRKILTS